MAEARSIHSFFLTAPNQHRPFCDLAGRTAQPCPSPALCALFPHPLQNRVPRGERAPVALRRAGLGSRPGRCWALPTREQHPSRQARPSPSAPATKPAKTLGFRRFSFCLCCMVIWCIPLQTAGFPICSHPFPTAATPSSTQKAPDFSFFGLNRVRFSLFRCFPAAKFLGLFLCILLHSVYKLKPSVIPCRREVSFLT